MTKYYKSTLRIIEYMDFLTVCPGHVTYAFQSESTLYSWLNVRELLACSSCSHLNFRYGFSFSWKFTSDYEENNGKYYAEFL